MSTPNHPLDPAETSRMLADADGHANLAARLSRFDTFLGNAPPDYAVGNVPHELEPIRSHWEQRARKYGLSPSASWVDETMLHREGEILKGYFKDGDRVLDAGCANGYTTIQLAHAKNIRITGVDYAPSMIENATAALGRAGALKGTAQFRIGNFLDLDFPDNSFDKVMTKRCLINLGSLQFQEQAIREAARVLKPGGMFLISDVSLQSAAKLNDLRIALSLEPMTPLWHNCYMDEEKLLPFIEQFFEVKRIRRFSSTYYVLTWALYPFFVRSGKRNYRSWYHHIAASLPQIGDWGLQKLFILKKRQD